MTVLFNTLADNGGFARKSFLLKAGATEAQIKSAFQAGWIFRVRHGWYALPGRIREVEEAMRVGGILAASTAVSSYGVWTVGSRELHVSVRWNSCRLRAPMDCHRRLSADTDSGVKIHWDQSQQHPAGGVFRVPLAEAILQLYRNRGEDEAVAAIDSALNKRLISLPQLSSAGVPDALLTLADPRAESGIESMTRIRLGRVGIRSQSQVEVLGIGRVDLVVGDRLVLELDGQEYHSGPVAFAADRDRDAKLAALGFVVLRFSYWQVVHDWAAVEAAIRSMVDARLHLGASKTKERDAQARSVGRLVTECPTNPLHFG